ncbi:hypothetical protein HH213_17815 [Duganella dendranthematis]|uniref:DUF551 domain-containing protein n=1 Tax=Duganella dendranthematis TaxID=2728021 RepID=A0ABX6MBT2_9BURK|nr:hypothetical protein [Duganella dendranthematis]QJD91781.1 hypothetical protein HH213_17815 [Duganella dendranthematis]
MTNLYPRTNPALPLDSQDLIYRLRTVAGQTVVQPPALDLEAADHIEKLAIALSDLRSTVAAGNEPQQSPYEDITLANLRAGNLSAARVYVGYCEVSEALKAANGAIKRYSDLTQELRRRAAGGWTSVKDAQPSTGHECTGREMMVSNSFFVRGVTIDGKEGFGMADYQEDGNWKCYGGDYDFMHIAEVTHYLPCLPSENTPTKQPDKAPERTEP